MKRFTIIISFFLFGICHSQISDFASIDFSQADKNAQAHKGASLQNLPELVNKLTLNLDTDVERFRAIYKWICTNISNDYKLFYKNKRKRRRYSDDSLKLEAWNKDFSQRVFKKLLKKNRTLCSGYAYLLKKMSGYAQLKVEIINGFGRTSTTNIETLDLPNHAWNAIKLNSKWYYCDPTWSSGKQDSKTGRFVFEYTDGFFLADPRLFKINHFPIEKRWQTIDSTAQTYTNFIEGPILYNASYTYLNAITAPTKRYHDIEKNTSIDFQFELKNLISSNAVKLRIIKGDTDKWVLPDAIEINSKALKFSKAFLKTGWYDVHIYFEDTPVLSITTKVSKLK